MLDMYKNMKLSSFRHNNIYYTNTITILSIGFLLLFAAISNIVPEINQVQAQDKGYELKAIKEGVYVVSVGGSNSMFLTTGNGVLVVDSPPNIGDKIFDAVAEVTNEPITHLVYSHAHKDHIGSANVFPSNVTIISQDETANLLKERNDTNRPVPDETFLESKNVTIGDKTVELFYPGPYHESGNIFIYIPEQKVLMVVDQFTPGGIPWKHLAATEYVPAFVKSVDQVLAYDFDTYVPGHGNTGTKEDVQTLKEYVNDLKTNAMDAFNAVNFTEATANVDKGNNAAMTEAYFNALTNYCTEKIDSKWNGKLNGIGVWSDEHCERMVISTSVD